jgi:trehalose 6-phosphate phosphatase
MNGISERASKTAQTVAAADHGAKNALRPSETAIRNKRKAPRSTGRTGSRKHLSAALVRDEVEDSHPTHSPRYAPGAWKEIRERIEGAKALALLLDFDGTLVKIQRRPDTVRVPTQTKRLLARLARHPKVYVTIVSGRRRLDLQKRIGVSVLHYIGLHGAEEAGRKTKVSKEAQRDLALAKSRVLKTVGSMPGMRIEDKRLSFAVHYRGAKPTIARAARRRLLEPIAPLCHTLKMLTGAMVWEVLPVEIRGKGVAARDLLNQFPPGTAGIYIGDDATDESAFRELHDQITIRVGKTKESHAHYYLRNPREVIHFLLRLESELLEGARGYARTQNRGARK